MHVIAAITGDIIMSRDEQDFDWKPLYEVFNRFGERPLRWDTTRGDGFQVLVLNPQDAFLSAMLIRAAVISIKKLDVRMSIGIGSMERLDIPISENNGTALIYSGDRFEHLKTERQGLVVSTGNADFDEEMNASLSLASVVMQQWTPAAAEYVRLKLTKGDISQQQMAEILGVVQSSVSERHVRSYFVELQEFDRVFRKKVSQLN